MNNWGFPFIGAFLIILFGAAVLLAVGSSSIAEITANVAYFALVVGVILQLICFSRKKPKNGDGFVGSS